MSHGSGNQGRHQDGSQYSWNPGQSWSFVGVEPSVWNAFDDERDTNNNYHIPHTHQQHSLPSPAVIEGQRGQSAYRSRVELPVPSSLDLPEPATSHPTSSSTNRLPPLDLFGLFNDQHNRQQDNDMRLQGSPVPVHQDNWLDRTTAQGREEDRFGYYTELFFDDDLFTGPVDPELPPLNNRRQLPSLSDSFAIPEHSDSQRLDPEMPVHTRHRTRNSVVDLTDGSNSSPDSAHRQPENRKRPAEGSSASGPSLKRGRPSVGKIEEVDLTNEGFTNEEKLLQAQQQEAIRSQQAAEEAKGPQRIGQRQCIICMENITNATTTVCGHFYCHECLTQALIAGERSSERNIGTCPVCRKPISRKKQHQIVPISFMKKETYDKARRKNLPTIA